MVGSDWAEFCSALDEGDTVYKLVTSLPYCSEEQLDYSSILALSVLFCPGNSKDKAAALFNSVNPPGQY